MKKFILAMGLAFGVCAPQSGVSAQDYKSYFNFGLGGDFALYKYDGRDPRMTFGFEYGHSYLALPLSLSVAEDVMIVGLKPRFQYPIQFPEFANLTILPGIGGVFNYWTTTQEGIDFDLIELGVQTSLNLKFNIHPRFNVMLTPIAVDHNFWRKIWVNVAGFGTSASESEYGAIYSAGASIGFNF